MAILSSYKNRPMFASKSANYERGNGPISSLVSDPSKLPIYRNAFVIILKDSEFFKLNSQNLSSIKCNDCLCIEKRNTTHCQIIRYRVKDDSIQKSCQEAQRRVISYLERSHVITSSDFYFFLITDFGLYSVQLWLFFAAAICQCQFSCFGLSAHVLFLKL